MYPKITFVGLKYFFKYLMFLSWIIKFRYEVLSGDHNSKRSIEPLARWSDDFLKAAGDVLSGSNGDDDTYFLVI